MKKRYKNIGGSIMERGEDGRWTTIIPAADGSERVYWCVAKEDGEVVMLHQGRKDRLSAEMLLHNHINTDDDLICYELTPEEYDQLYDRVHEEWAQDRRPKDLNVQTRKCCGRIKQKQLHLPDHTGEFTRRHMRTVEEMVEENIKAEAEHVNAAIADRARRRQLKGGVK